MTAAPHRDSPAELRVARVVAKTEAEGPGLRSAIWLQGCPLRCPSCCNPEMLEAVGGQIRSVDSLAEEMWRTHPEVSGITLLGGEPFFQAEGAGALARLARSEGRSVMVFTGHLRANLEGRRDPHVDALLEQCDLLVDGPYLQNQPDSTRRWIGSRNQVMHFLSDRYDPQAPIFRERESVEIRFSAGSLTVNGWPSASDEVVRKA